MSPDTALDCNFRPAVNFGERVGCEAPDLIILHYTGMKSGSAALDWLVCEESGVSCHYLVEEDGRIFQMVPENKRAWHAGKSWWQGMEDINSRSIGIEIVNPGHEFGYRPFPECQISSVISLCRDIISRNRMSAQNILAHSDVAPGRKIDPGELFPWQRFSQEGLGLWVEPVDIGDEPDDILADVSIMELDTRLMLTEIGYGIEINEQSGPSLFAVLDAFQRHFRQKKVDGILDRSTAETIRRVHACNNRAPHTPPSGSIAD